MLAVTNRRTGAEDDTMQLSYKLKSFSHSPVLVLSSNVDSSPTSTSSTNSLYFPYFFSSYSSSFIPSFYPGGTIQIGSKMHIYLFMADLGRFQDKGNVQIGKKWLWKKTCVFLFSHFSRHNKCNAAVIELVWCNNNGITSHHFIPS